MDRLDYPVTRRDLELMAGVVESRITLKLEREKTTRMFFWLKAFNIALLLAAAVFWVVSLSR